MRGRVLVSINHIAPLTVKSGFFPGMGHEDFRSNIVGFIESLPDVSLELEKMHLPQIEAF